MENYIFYHKYFFRSHFLFLRLVMCRTNFFFLFRSFFLKTKKKQTNLICWWLFDHSFLSPFKNNNFFPFSQRQKSNENRLTETARLLVRTNVRRVFGTGGTSRSHSAEKREMELKRKYRKLMMTNPPTPPWCAVFKIRKTFHPNQVCSYELTICRNHGSKFLVWLVANVFLLICPCVEYIHELTFHNDHWSLKKQRKLS